MEDRAALRARVQDLLDVDTDDTYHSEAQINTALNDVLTETADRLCATVARRRYMKRVADLEVASGFNTTTLVWTLPSDFRRPFELIRGGVRIKEVKNEDDFGTFGANGYIVVGKELWLTATTDPEDLEVWYFYTPAEMSADASTPDFVEGFEAFLALLAAARRETKRPDGNPKRFRDEAGIMWSSLIVAARNAALPANIHSVRGAHGEDWQ